MAAFVEQKGEIRGAENWAKVHPQDLGGEEFCPGAITEYAYAFSKGKRPAQSLVLDVRKHLFHLGWKIERLKYNINSYRYRYTSPDGSKAYLSLHLLCRELRNPTMQSFSPAAQNSFFHGLKEDCFTQPQARKRKREDEQSEFPLEVESPTRGRGKVIETLKKLRDDQDSNQPTSKPTSGRGKVIETLEKLRDDKQRSCERPKRKPASSSTYNLSILSLLIDNNVVAVGAKVHYRGTKKKLKEGEITPDGIKCNCCEKIFSLTDFEAHAGSTKHRPSENIILEDGRSLLDCRKEMGYEGKRQRIKMKSKRKNEDDNDYLCSICHDAGDLVLCDLCPAAFHKRCIGLDRLLHGTWACPFCCCFICGQNKLQESTHILNCDQCFRKFHIRCAKDGRKNFGNNWFCGYNCEKICASLQKLVGKPIEVGENGLTWTLLKSMDSNSRHPQDLYSRLKLALEVMHECFEPVEEAYSGTDIVEDVIFGKASNLSRLDFRGFYTIVIERNNELTCAANVRILGEKVAEVPLVATRFRYRRRGMCRILMTELERQLMEMGVDKLVLPAASSALATWKNGFGFSEMTDSDRREYLHHSFLHFHGTTMCQKFLREIPSG